MNMNKCQIAGNLTRDPEIKFTTNGKAIGKFSIAVNRSWEQDGEKKKETTFLDVVVFGRSAEAMQGRIEKGSPVFVEGRIAVRSFETKEGQKRTVYEINAEMVHFLYPAPKEHQNR